MSRGLCRPLRVAFSVVLILVLTAAALPARAQQSQDFGAWLAAVKLEAASRGISQPTIAAAFRDLEPLARVIELDRRQPEFTTTFWGYVSRAVSENRIARGKELLAKHGRLLRELRQRYGVPPRVLVAFWGLETNYGSNMGGFPVIGALATLAYDNRRADFFRSELFDALRIVDRGHISAGRMVGSWAGAMGHVQFLPSTYLRHAVDHNGDGRRDIWNSVPDALASAANYLRAIAWNAGELWGREVRLPPDFDIGQANLKTRKSVREWRQLGVRKANGSNLPNADVMGAIMLPGGHKGPAFLVYRNFDVIMEWNRSLLYALAVGILSDRIGDRPPLVATAPPDERPMSRREVEEIQQLLVSLGYEVGEVDGVVGAQTRAALRSFQQSAKLPPDGYPTPLLLERLRRAKRP